MSELMQLGFIGTGTMGNPMARCLIEAGHRLTVHDTRREATTNLCEVGRQLGGQSPGRRDIQPGCVHFLARTSGGGGDGPQPRYGHPGWLGPAAALS